jgi:hypothetical protein
MKLEVIKFDDKPEHDNIVFTHGANSVEVGDLDKDDEVAFEVMDDEATILFYLTQENIQQLINHLQKQLK